MGRGGKKRRVPAGQAPDLPLPAESAVLRVSFLPAEQGRHAVPSGKRGGHILCALPRRRRGKRAGVRPLFCASGRERPAPGGMRSSDGADVGPAGEIPASAKRHPMTRPLPKPSMGKSRAGDMPRRPVYKEKSLSLKRALAGARKKSGARRKNVTRRRGERADSPVDGLILRVAKLRL